MDEEQIGIVYEALKTSEASGATAPDDVAEKALGVLNWAATSKLSPPSLRQVFEMMIYLNDMQVAIKEFKISLWKRLISILKLNAGNMEVVPVTVKINIVIALIKIIREGFEVVRMEKNIRPDSMAIQLQLFFSQRISACVSFWGVNAAYEGMAMHTLSFFYGYLDVQSARAPDEKAWVPLKTSAMECITKAFSEAQGRQGVQRAGGSTRSDPSALLTSHFSRMLECSLHSIEKLPLVVYGFGKYCGTVLGWKISTEAQPDERQLMNEFVLLTKCLSLLETCSTGGRNRFLSKNCLHGVVSAIHEGLTKCDASKRARILGLFIRQFLAAPSVTMALVLCGLVRRQAERAQTSIVRSLIDSCFYIQHGNPSEHDEMRCQKRIMEVRVRTPPCGVRAVAMLLGRLLACVRERVHCDTCKYLAQIMEHATARSEERVQDLCLLDQIETFVSHLPVQYMTSKKNIPNAEAQSDARHVPSRELILSYEAVRNAILEPPKQAVNNKRKFPLLSDAQVHGLKLAAFAPRLDTDAMAEGGAALGEQARAVQAIEGLARLLRMLFGGKAHDPANQAPSSSSSSSSSSSVRWHVCKFMDYMNAISSLCDIVEGTSLRIPHKAPLTRDACVRITQCAIILSDSAVCIAEQIDHQDISQRHQQRVVCAGLSMLFVSISKLIAASLRRIPGGVPGGVGAVQESEFDNCRKTFHNMVSAAESLSSADKSQAQARGQYRNASQPPKASAYTYLSRVASTAWRCLLKSVMDYANSIPTHLKARVQTLVPSQVMPIVHARVRGDTAPVSVHPRRADSPLVATADLDCNILRRLIVTQCD